MFRRINKILSILLVICMVISMIPAAVSAATPSTLFLKPNSEWLADGARFAAYFFGNGETWVSMSDSDGDGYYEAAVPSGYTSVIFCRMNGTTTANTWDNKWNQTADLTIPTDGTNCCTLTSGVWDSDTGSWSTYSTTKDYYLFGFINGANYACEEDEANMGSYKFVDGKLTATFTEDSYVAIKTTNNANWYMAQSYISTTSGTFYDVSTGTTEKMYVPGNVEVYFTLTVNSDGSLGLSYTTNACDHSYTSSITTAATCTTAGVRTYTCSLCGDSYTESIAANGHTISGTKCTVCGYSTSDGITIHLVNTLGWNDVVGYFWSDNGTATALAGYEWPGVIVNKDADGYFTVNVPYSPTSGESFGFLFHNWNGGQTADYTVSYDTLSSSKELWVKPGTTANSDGKYDCTVATSESSLNVSPEINGTSVTFRYEGSATSVYLAGSFNDWSSTANAMTYSNGVWSTTLTLAAGVHEYKFVVDDAWVTDPGNGMVGGFDGNSVVVVSSDDTTENTGKIDVVIHYYRSDDTYTNWDVWFWDNESSGSANFSADPVNKGMMATYTVNGSTNSNVGFIIRKNDWSSQEFSDRYVDLTDVISGTVHYYVNADTWAGSRVLGEDVVLSAKPSYAKYNYEAGTVWVKSTLPYSGSWSTAFSILDADGNASGITVAGATMDGNGYTLTLSRELTLIEAATYLVEAYGLTCSISYNAHDMFYTDKFASEYTYHGDDLGAVYSSTSTTFKVWAPTALKVHVKLFDSGNWGSGNQLQYVEMAQGDAGIWYVTISGDLHGIYYNYDVTFPTYTVEATDPYAKGCGANGDRGMIVDFDRLNPTGWENDVSPNQGMNYTDAIIYEMHIREMTIDSSSGVNDAWKGKYLGLTQAGTNYDGRATGLDHLKELGITHVQLMPVYDMNSIDEYHLTDWAQYGWGYDPKNYSCVEGSYATDPYDGSTRITEFKQMVQTFHSNGINVVMDVVYNHAFDGGNFCGNKIVPNYYSRFYGEGNWSNGSGCGNDLATERVMVRKYIVDSVVYWADEYHIDGFRFDLAGLIDTDTINAVIEAVHATHPNVIFYGEGWNMATDLTKDGCTMATQANSTATPGFSYFSDFVRDSLRGSNSNASQTGYLAGGGGYTSAVRDTFMGKSTWCKTPSQTINYISCHDGYALWDRLFLSTREVSDADRIRMNNLGAAIILTSQGTPFFQAGEEMLRSKPTEDGFEHNSYKSSDEVNSIKWDNLNDPAYADVADYYAGLVAFRKAHPALRMTTAEEVEQHITVLDDLEFNVMACHISAGANGEDNEIVAIFNPRSAETVVTLPEGVWNICVNAVDSGTETLGTAEGTVTVDAISACVLVKEAAVEEVSTETVPTEETPAVTPGMTLFVAAGALVVVAIGGIVMLLMSKRKN